MEGHLTHECPSTEVRAPAWTPWPAQAPHPARGEPTRAWLRQALTTERIWEPVFVSTAFSLWGWYVFWLYRAVQDYTIVPWP
jgi:hypothetical protein